jgi:hypothetical protein
MPDRHALDHYDDRELDQQIDRALASYADQEPDPALRTRILARAADAAPRPKRLWLLAPAATACAAAILIALLLHPPAHAPVSQPQNGSSVATAPESRTPIVATAPQKIAHPSPVFVGRRTYRTGLSSPPRNASFPSPSPLTAEEKILLNFAAEHPEQARQVLTITAADRAPLDTRPLSIAPIRIAALVPPRPLTSEENPTH